MIIIIISSSSSSSSSNIIKLEWLGYRVVKKQWRYVKPYSSDTGTNGQTDGRTDRFAISVSRDSMLTRDKNMIIFGRVKTIIENTHYNKTNQ